MPTGTAFVTVFMTFAGKAYIAVMETVLSVQAVVKRSIRSTFLFKYEKRIESKIQLIGTDLCFRQLICFFYPFQG